MCVFVEKRAEVENRADAWIFFKTAGVQGTCWDPPRGFSTAYKPPLQSFTDALSGRELAFSGQDVHEEADASA